MIKLPLRTAALMVGALAAYAWMYWQTHKAADVPRPKLHVTQIIPLTQDPQDAGGGDQ